MMKFLCNLSFVFLTISVIAQEQWQRLPGPVGTEVTSILQYNNKIYAGTYSGIFTSVDQGSTWQPDVNGMYGGMYIWSMASNGETLIAATSDGIYYKNGDGGWQQSEMLNLMMKVISNGDVFLAKAHSNFHIFRSTDGIHWADTGYAAGAMGTSGSTMFLDTTTDILRSTDGINWQGINASLPGFGYSAIGGDGSVLLVSRFDGGVFRSTNNGNSFTQVIIPTGVNDQHRAHNFTFRGTTVYANIFGQKDEIYYSDDHGITWNKRNPGLQPAVFGWGGMIAEENYQLVAGYEGIYRSTNGGVTWSFDASNGLANSTVNGLVMNQGKLHALTGFDVGGSFGFYSSSNFGQSWQVPSPQSFGKNGNLHFGTVVNDVLLVKNGSTLSRSTDNGITWTNLLLTPSSSEMSALFASGSRVLMATNFDKLYYSDDTGLTWTQAATSNIIVNCFTSKDNVLYAGTGSGVQKSTDNGTTWTLLPAIIPGPYDVIKMVSNSSHLFAAVQSGGAYIQLYRSADNGLTWVNIHGSLPDGFWSSIAIEGNTLLVGNNIQGVDFTASHLYRSDNNGETWQSFKDGMFVESDITYLGHFDNKWWAGTESAGLWVVNDGALSTSSFGTMPSMVVSPNPTAGIAYIVIPSQLGQLQNVLLSDLNGRKVKQWENDALTTVDNKLSIDFEETAPGIYMLTVQGSEGSSFCKIVKQ